ncbi:hypothetical protein GCM10009536_08270 [Streptomyces thermocarboxydus]
MQPYPEDRDGQSLLGERPGEDQEDTRHPIAPQEGHNEAPDHHQVRQDQQHVKGPQPSAQPHGVLPQGHQ